jgi:anti-sigma factor RsiW
MPDQESAEARRESTAPGTTRRGMLRGAAGIGAAGLAAGVLGAGVAGPALAATAKPASDDTRSAAHDEPLVVHVHDARTGVVDLYTGEQHVRFTDHQLAARLARAAS